MRPEGQWESLSSCRLTGVKLALTQEATSRLGGAEGHGRMNRGAARAQRPREGGLPGNWPAQGQGLGKPGAQDVGGGEQGSSPGPVIQGGG